MNLLLFSFSPVQGFLSTSRKTKDLFAGSYIISYLTEEVINRLKLKDKVIFPV
ncbi:type III-B CRISPR-associated protein Cas10/Cmr2 [Aquifex pyrophilus]